MDFKFESLPDRKLINGSAYLMDFGAMSSQEDAAIAEGKLLSAFGKPTSNGKSYENSLEYIIHATAENGESVILSVYSVGVIHIGAHQR